MAFFFVRSSVHLLFTPKSVTVSKFRHPDCILILASAEVPADFSGFSLSDVALDPPRVKLAFHR